jgi:type I restriction enzyme R subunit
VRGFAQHMHDALPHATFVAFTGTPLELADKDTRIVFGDYIDIYDVSRAIADKATVPIYYESRLIKLDLKEGQSGLLDEEFEELAEDEEETRRDRLKSRWSQLEAVVGTPKRLREVADDLVEHMRLRQEAMTGKVMIVCMSRRICVELYNQIKELHPEWHNDDDAQGAIKIVMTGSASDHEDWQPHIRNKARREELAKRFKDESDPFRIVIVRDMWLTGFDVPSLHTMYLDKPMKGHGLMQAIARVNRVFANKPGGLVVDYLGLANNLKAALRAYIRDDGEGGKPIENEKLDGGELVAAMLEKLDLCRSALYGFNYNDFLVGSPSERLTTVTNAMNFLIGKNYPDTTFIPRFLDNALALQQAFKLASATKQAQAIKLEFAFFMAVRAQLSKLNPRGGSGKTEEELDSAVRQLVDEAISPDGVVDIFDVAGLQKPDISILSDAFLLELKDMPQKNLAMELLKKLLNDEIHAKRKTSVVQARRFSEKLNESLNRYHNRGLETTQIIDALIELAKEMRESEERGGAMGLVKEELAFYDALAENGSAVDVLGDLQLRVIAREVADTVRQNTRIDWQYREQARADLRRHVRRALRNHGYPPDQAEAATVLVLEQAELFAREETKPVYRYRG